MLFVVGPKDFAAAWGLQPQGQTKIPVKTATYPDAIRVMWRTMVVELDTWWFARSMPILRVTALLTDESSGGKVTSILTIFWYYLRTGVTARAVNKKFMAKLVDGLSGIPKSTLHERNSPSSPHIHMVKRRYHLFDQQIWRRQVGEPSSAQHEVVDAKINKSILVPEMVVSTVVRFVGQTLTTVFSPP